MSNTDLPYKKITVVITIALLLAVIGASVIRFWFPDFDVVTFIGVMATLSIAFLTVAYVFITSNQLGVMEKQLKEMARTRELDAQPLPYLEIKKVYLEKPRFFYTPPEDHYSATPRLIIQYRLANHGAHPAINITAAARVILNIDDEEIEIDGGAREVSMLKPNGEYPPEPEDNIGFMFNGDGVVKLLGILRDRSFRKPALITIRFIYRNILGGYFSNTWYFEIAPRSEEDFEVLTNWDSRLISFQTEYKEKISSLRKLFDKDREAWHEQFDIIKESLDETLQGDKEHELAWFQIPNSFHAAVISKKRYEIELKDRNFGTPIPQWMTSCIAKESDD